MNTFGLEVTGVPVPFWKWNVASNGKQRAARQRRRDFSELKLIKCASHNLNKKEYRTEIENGTVNGPKRTAGNRTKSTVKSSKQSKDRISKGKKRTGIIRNKCAVKSLKESHVFIDKGSKRSRDTPESDPEKVGVRILGHHFSDNLECCLIKKRRIRLVRSPSSHSAEDSYGLPLIEAKFAAGRSTEIPERDDELSEAPDTSNLWLLATTAEKNPNAVLLVSNKNASGGEVLSTNVESDALTEVKEKHLFSASGISDVTSDKFSSLGKVQNALDTIEPSRNGRFHWDLNIRMDEWGCSIDETVNAKVPSVTIENGDGICHEKVVNMETCQVQTKTSHSKHGPVLPDSIAHLGGQIAEDFSISSSGGLGVPKDGFELQGSSLTGSVFSCDSSFADNKNDEECVLPCSDELIKEHHELHAPVVATGMDEGTECLIVQSTIVQNEDSLDPEKDSSLINTSNPDVKNDTYHLCPGLLVETETQSSCQTLRENTSMEGASQGSESLCGVGRRASEDVLQENVFAGSNGYHDTRTVGSDLTKVEISARKKVHLHTDMEVGEIDQHFDHSRLGEDASDMLVNMADRSNASKMTVADGRPGEVSHTDVSDNDISDNADNSRVDMSSCSSGSRPFIFQASSPHDVVSSGSTSVGEFVVTNVDVKTKSSDQNMLADKSVNNTKSGDPICNSFNQSNYESAHMMQGKADASEADGALSSHATHRSCVGGFINSTSGGALMDHADCGYDSNISQTVNDQVIGVQNVMHPSDDESEYEDGEIRGSVINDYREDDDSEEVETKYVNYGSDNREKDVQPAALHLDNVEYKNMRLSEVYDGTQVQRDAQGRHNTFDGIRRVDCKATDARDSAMGIVKNIGNVDFSKESDGVRKLSNSANLMVNSSVWGQGLYSCRNSRGEAVLTAGSVGESIRKSAGSTSRRHLSSRIEKPDYSIVPHSKNRYYVKATRCDDDKEWNFKFGDVDRSGSLRRGRASLPPHNRGHGGPGSFTPHGSKSVLRGVAAQLESNGFVMADDGTVIKARPGCSRNTLHSIRRRSPIGRSGAYGMRKQVDNRREMSPDKHINGSHRRNGKYGSGVARTELKERYHGPMPYQQQSRREQSFSPSRRPIHLSRPFTRSSRSRTPPRLTPPREGSDHGIDRSPVRRRSRSSLHFRSEVINERMGSQTRYRMRSPHRRPGFKRVMGFARSTRDHMSPPYGSRQTCERNEPLHQLRGRERSRSAGMRREHAKGFLQDQTFSLTDSPEGLNSDKCYPLMRSGRSPDSVNASKGSRHDNDGDQRSRRVDNYEKLYLMSKRSVAGSIEDMVHGVYHQKFSSELQKIGSPTRFEGHFDSDLINSPQRVVRSGDPSRCGGNGKNGFSFKSFGVQDCDDDMASHSRPS